MIHPFTLKLTTPSENQLLMTRQFAAPRELVFQAMTTPALLKRWLLGPAHWTMPVCEIDLKVGGTYRYVWQNTKNGQKMGMGGVYREITHPSRIVATERFDDAWYPGEDALSTLVLTEKDGVTTLNNTMTYASKEALDAVLKSGMEGGVTASYNRLDEVFASLTAK